MANWAIGNREQTEGRIHRQEMYVTKQQNSEYANYIAKNCSLKKITLTEVKKAIQQNSKWSGWMVGNNVNGFHVKDNFHFGCFCTVTTLDELEQFKREFLFHLEPELGNDIHYYEELPIEG